MPARLCSLLMVALTLPAFAADPKLPPEGSWARYYVQHYDYDGDEHTFEVVIRCLGTTTVGDDKCRWIEIHYPENKNVPFPWTSATRLAIPEKQILTAQKLISDDTHGYYYYKQDGENPELDTIAAKRQAGTVFVHDMMFGSYLQFLPGPRQSAEVSPTHAVIPHAKGQLTATQALSGKRNGEFVDSVDGRTRWDGTYKILTNDDIPFGFASAEFTWNTSFPDDPDREPSGHWVVKENWSLQEFGTGAKSSIPEPE